MERMEAAATHDILVISDSDVRVTSDYLRAVALPFADLQRGRHVLPLSRRCRRGRGSGRGLKPSA
jgi:cellulose synthase/poly-beta-1,6-N-acetylglucosamine synthase-like glycosyltransferase